ncbi:hypothetical protein [Streptomyces sp. NPDC060333]|uniref:hypothetical protein n=1 Tax=Streptomyces sp. NPDC060333 TaxID=3347098 RepID=UPI00364E1134
MSETITMPLTPMTPHAVMSAFNYLRAMEAGDTEAAAEFIAAEPRMPALLIEVAHRIVIPTTNLPDRDEKAVPCDGSFALFELGICFLDTLRSWHEQAGAGTAPGLALAVIRFTTQILTQDHEEVSDVLQQLDAIASGAGGAPTPHRLTAVSLLPVGGHLAPHPWPMGFPTDGQISPRNWTDAGQRSWPV